MVNAVRATSASFRPVQQRSDDKFRSPANWCATTDRQLKSVHVNVGGTSNWAFLPEQPIPPGLDWDRWLGLRRLPPTTLTRASGNYSRLAADSRLLAA